MTRIFCLLLALVLGFAPAARADSPIIFAAASLTEALTEAAAAWAAEGHAKPRLNFAASSILARQIDQGAPAAIFASADTEWMDWLAARDRIVPDTRRNLLGNSLVLVMPRARAHPVAIGPGLDLAGLLGPGGRLATGDPAHVPVGIYAREALTRLGLWNAAKDRIAAAANVRSALLLVERGEVPAGIVYATDVAAAPGVAIAGTFPEDSHAPIVYPFAIVRAGDTPEARALLAFLASPAARAIFTRHGFRVP